MEILYPQDNKPVRFNYAGFWLRLVAIFFDSILVGIINLSILVSFFGIRVLKVHFLTMHPFKFKIMAAWFPAILVAIAVKWLYFALMESSKHQATPGKMAVDLKVTDTHGSRISFARASGRFFGKFISSMIFNIGYIMAAFTEKKQALHDKLADTLVLKS